MNPEAMLEPVVEEEPEDVRAKPRNGDRRESTVAQIPALVRIPLCPPPVPPPPLPENDDEAGEAADLSRAIMARRRSSAAASVTSQQR